MPHQQDAVTPKWWVGLKTMISTNQLKNGNHIEVDGVVYKVMEFQHVNP